VARTAANSTTVVSSVRVGAIAAPTVNLHVWILHQVYRSTTSCISVGSNHTNTDSHSNNVAVGCVVVGTCAIIIIIIIISTTNIIVGHGHPDGRTRITHDHSHGRPRITHDHRIVKGVRVGVDVVRVAG